MGDFFRGWRRKAGCVTLVMACLAAGVWVRSFLIVDILHFEIGNRLYCFDSRYGVLTWGSSEYDFGDQSIGNGWRAYDARLFLPWGVRTDEFEGRATEYWCPAVFLTLLSGYLILWKPRKRESRPPQS